MPASAACSITPPTWLPDEQLTRMPSLPLRIMSLIAASCAGTELSEPCTALNWLM